MLIWISLLLAPVLNFIPAGVGFLDWAGLQEKRISSLIWEKKKEEEERNPKELKGFYSFLMTNEHWFYT